MTRHDDQRAPHSMSDRLLVGTWAALICLTALTIAVAQIHLGFYNIMAALGIATTKALLVIYIFMHMKFERSLIRWLLVMACVVLAIFIGMTFFDVGLRYSELP